MSLQNPFHIAPDESAPHSAELRHFVFRGAAEIGSHTLTGLRLRHLRSESGTCDFFDTHVWSLWFSDAILAREKGWILQVGGEAFGTPETSQTPKFATDFPESPLREHLRDLADIRALRKTASVLLHREFWEAHDASGKALFRLSLCRIASARTKKFRTTLLEILPVRGGKMAHERLFQSLLEKGWRPTHENLVQEAYKLCKGRPSPYSLKLRLEFAPETHARTVLLEIFSCLLSIARWNEEGVIKDIDTEFLHDYRVSLRKLRSVTGQMKGVFPDSLTEAWKKQIGDLCRRTNALRDYDVYLLCRDRLEKMLPEELRGGLDAFFKELKAERHIEAALIAKFLRSETYKHQIVSLQEAWASAHSMEPTLNSALPILEVAGERILKRFRRIRKTSKSIKPETPDSVIHSIRIDCKKMRYLLECFGHLFPSEAVDPLARQLSKLQNRLGRYNDTSLQQDYLLQYAGRNLESGDTRLALSLGALIGSLHQEHAALREKLCDTLKTFTRGANARTAASLMRNEEK